MGKTFFSWEVFLLGTLNHRLNVNVSKSRVRNSTLHQHTHGHGDAASASAHRVGEGLGQDGDDAHPVASCPVAAPEGFPSPHIPHGVERGWDAGAATGCRGMLLPCWGTLEDPALSSPCRDPAGTTLCDRAVSISQ